MTTVFFSYSHKDEELRDRLEVHLAMLKRDGTIETWYDRRIAAGDEFAGVIDEQVETADLILLLVSADFLNSNYCYEIEMKRAMERHTAREARVIPIILRHCDWHTSPFGKLMAAPKDGRPIVSWPDLDEAFVVRQIRGALPHPARRPNATLPVNSTPAQTTSAQRSSNLRVKKTFTAADHDRDDGFDFIARFFEASLAELDARNEDIEVRFKRIDANKFTASVYRQGKSACRCKIALGGMFKGISFSHNDNPSDNAINESLSVQNDDQSLFFKPLGIAHLGGSGSKHLTFEGAAEYYWAIFIEPLQR